MGIDALIAMLVPVIAGTIGAWFWFGDDARRTRRVLRSVRVTPVAALVDGQLACVVGMVDDERLSSTTTSMVAFRLTLTYPIVMIVAVIVNVIDHRWRDRSDETAEASGRSACMLPCPEGT